MSGNHCNYYSFGVLLMAVDISIEEAGAVCNRFFDYDDGDFAMSISDSMAMDSDGNLMMRMGDHMAMDMDTGDIHMISSWSDDDEE